MDFEDIIVSVNKPFPQIVGATNNKTTVGILKNLATSKTGELAGILQYIYQSVIADKTNADIAKIFEEISIVEMTHLDVLMHTISSFGGVPKFEDAQGNTFNTSQINYSQKLIEMLDGNIADETLAIEEYTKAINMVDNQSLKELLLRIMEDEKLHLDVFKYIRDHVMFFST